MQSRVLHRILAILLIGAFALPAAAQFSRDGSANKKIDEAINTHYLMMELDEAEKMLVEIVESCAMDCSPGVKAKAWMYVGIVRGSGKNDLGGAEEAFATAKAYEPGVQLDEALATPETKATFDGAGGESAAPAAAPAAATAAAAPVPTAPGEVPGDMLCTPEQRDILTRMPLPISCSTNLDAASAVLKFREPGGSEWKQVEMQKVGDFFQAEIPCSLTNSPGQLLFYVGARDASGDYIDQYGSKKQPGFFNLSNDTGSPAPAFPGQAPVTRCASAEDCPPDFPGCAGSAAPAQCGDLDWGASCDNSSQCKCGLACDAGTCVQAQACQTDEECGGGESCLGGYCSVPAGSGASGPYKKHWLGGSFGADVTFVGGDALCVAERGDSYSTYCLNADGSRAFDADIGVGSGPAMGQLRFKLGYDYALTDKMMVGAKVGFAFLNTPSPNGTDPAVGAFLPIHLEGRFTYNFTSLGKKGFRPAFFVNLGLAEVSTAIPFQDATRSLSVHKRAGLLFFGGGVNLGYAIADNMNLGLDLGFQVLTAYYVTSVAVHPALSFVYAL